jgi:tRNA (mo5U34)-methyltransferase
VYGLTQEPTLNICDSLTMQTELIRWWHGGMNLGGGMFTKGISQPERNLLPAIALPQDLNGKTVLDIGTWDGYMAFECERRGASRVVAVDSFVWSEAYKEVDPKATGRAGFDLAHSLLDSKVEAVECEVLDLSPAQLGTFDIVLFLGVLYHMRHPLLALERVAAMTKELLIIESHVISDKGKPVMAFYPGRELNNDPTNWWGPNTVCIEAMLMDVGFDRLVQVSENNGRAAYHAWRTIDDMKGASNG